MMNSATPGQQKPKPVPAKVAFVMDGHMDGEKKAVLAPLQKKQEPANAFVGENTIAETIQQPTPNVKGMKEPERAGHEHFF